MNVIAYRKTLVTVALFVVACLATRMLLTRNWRTHVLRDQVGAPKQIVSASLYEILAYIAGGIILAMLREVRRMPLTHPVVVITQFVFVMIGMAIFKGQLPHLPSPEQGA